MVKFIRCDAPVTWQTALDHNAHTHTHIEESSVKFYCAMYTVPNTRIHGHTNISTSFIKPWSNIEIVARQYHCTEESLRFALIHSHTHTNIQNYRLACGIQYACFAWSKLSLGLYKWHNEIAFLNFRLIILFIVCIFSSCPVQFCPVLSCLPVGRSPLYSTNANGCHQTINGIHCSSITMHPSA